MLMYQELSDEVLQLRPVMPQAENGYYTRVDIGQERAHGLAQYLDRPRVFRSLGMNVLPLVQEIQAGMKAQPPKYAVYIADMSSGQLAEAVVYERLPGPGLPGS